MKNYNQGYIFRIGSLVFVVLGYDPNAKKYKCRLWNSDNIYYFSARQIFSK